MTRSEHDLSFEAMGSRVRLLIGEPEAGAAAAAGAAERARRFVESFEAALSRFDPASELCALNADPRERVPASQLMRRAVAAARAAAECSGGLVDPTLAGAIERAGYVESRVGVAPASLTEALAAAPSRRPAAPAPAQRWRELAIDEEDGVVIRPPGLRIDSGGFGKGLCADLVAADLAPYSRFVVDCGGDIRIGGRRASEQPFAVEVEHPLSGGRNFVVRLGSGGIATSGLEVRIWRDAEGRFAHHLLDPASGAPAWTGLIGATALGTSALEAETLSKAALLSGPLRAAALLREQGGILVHDDGRVERVGPLAAPPRIRLPEIALQGAAA